MRSSIEIVDHSDNADVELMTLADLKIELGVTTEDEDTALEARITRASKFLAEQCERRFAFTHAIETFTFEPGERARVLILRLYPNVAIESVVSGGSELEESSFRVDPDTGELWLSSGVWSGSVVVTYSGGYFLPDDAPMRLQEAVIALIRDARLAASSSDSALGALRQITHGDDSVGFYAPSTSSSAAGGLPSGVADTIRFYKNATLA